MRNAERSGVGMLFAVVTLIWGSTWLAIKFQLGPVVPEVSVAYRFLLASLLLAAWCVSQRKSLRFTARQHRLIALHGVLMFGLNYLGVYWAEQYATSGLVAVLFSTIVFMNAIGARIAFGTPLGVRTLSAAALGVTGVALLFLPELLAARAGGDAALGVAFGLAATALASAGTFAALRNQRASIPLLPGIAWGMLYGSMIAAAAAVARGAHWGFETSVPYVLSLLYLSVFGTIVAFGAFLTLLKRVGPGPSAYVNVATPVVALALSTLFEGYHWTWVSALGVALALVANGIALRPAAPAAGRAGTASG